MDCFFYNKRVYQKIYMQKLHIEMCFSEYCSLSDFFRSMTLNITQNRVTIFVISFD